MRIQASCESCFHDFAVASTAAGKRVKCPECGEAVRLPMDDGEDEPAPRKSSGGKRKSEGKSTEGNNTVLIGATVHGKVATYTPHAAELPLALQDHGNPDSHVSFRNIWIRRLNR